MRQILELDALTESEQFVCETDARTIAIPLINEEADWDLSSINDMERINYVIEAQPGSLAD
jgi:hypothetical protein